MQENWNDSELRLVVTGTRRDGRRRYDLRSKHSLARAYLEPGGSLAGMALKHGVNANLLRKWVVGYQRACDAAAPTMAVESLLSDAFVPVVLGGSSATRIEKLRRPAPSATGAVITPPARLCAQLPNGVTLEFECTAQDAALVEQSMGRDPFARAGIEVARGTMGQWMVGAAQRHLQRLYEAMQDVLLAQPLIHGDETRVQVLQEDGKSAQSQSYMWVYRSADHHRTNHSTLTISP